MNAPSTHVASERLALSAADAAALVGVSRAQWWKLHSAGKVPVPVYLGAKAPRWRVDELRAWLAAGAPDRQTWLRLREVSR
jgi:predicted DNA-binding transcriptional regulator AlpA